MARIAVVGRGSQPFSDRDAELLAPHDVELVDVRRPRDWIRSLAAAWRADAVLVWFASVHAIAPLLIARVRGRPAVVIPGGYEVIWVPAAGYGWQNRRSRRWLVRLVLRSANVVVAVSPAIAQRIRDVDPRVDPVLVPNAVATPDAPPSERLFDVATSIASSTESAAKLKGVDAFVAAARLRPDLRFVVVGPYAGAVPSNVTVTGRVHPDEAAAVAGSARVYVQATRGFDAFGVALLEAMARGAVPVVTDSGGPPYVVGPAGIVIPAVDAATIAAGIDDALAHGDSQRAWARALEFSPARRRARLLEALGLVADRDDDVPVR